MVKTNSENENTEAETPAAAASVLKLSQKEQKLEGQAWSKLVGMLANSEKKTALQEVLKRLDKKNDGQISICELMDGLAILGLVLLKEEEKMFYRSLDIDGSKYDWAATPVVTVHGYAGFLDQMESLLQRKCPLPWSSGQLRLIYSLLLQASHDGFEGSSEHKHLDSMSFEAKGAQARMLSSLHGKRSLGFSGKIQIIQR